MKMVAILLLCAFFVNTVTAIGDDGAINVEWSYEGWTASQHWPDYYPQCGGKRQSPIDIDDVEYRDVGNVRFSSDFYSTRNARLTIKNTGHTLQVDVGDLIPLISGGGLPTTYRLSQLHLHWGRDPTEGSEHTWEGHKFAGEIHLVHYRSDLNRLPDAVTVEPNGVAIMALFVEESEEDNEYYDLIIDNIQNVLYKGMTYEVELPFTLRRFLPLDIDNFFRYRGSLTTPPCYQSVVWTIFEDPVRLSRDQIQTLQNLFHKQFDSDSNTNMLFNFRPPQARHERLIVTNDKNYNKRVSQQRKKDSLLWKVLHTEVKSFEGRKLNDNFLA